MTSAQPCPPTAELDRAAVFAALRARLARADHSAGTAAGSIALADVIDHALPGGGLARAAIHEVLAAEPGAAAGFAALALARSLGSHAGATVCWIAPEPDAWPPGLIRFGLPPENLVLVQARRPTDGLWAMEECLRCPGVAGAALTLDALDMTAARRLQLAAEAGGALGLLLRPDDPAAATGATAALTRWRVDALPGGGGPHDLSDPSWRLALLRGRGARPQAWGVTWRATEERLDVTHAERLVVATAERLVVATAERLDAAAAERLDAAAAERLDAWDAAKTAEPAVRRKRAAR